MADLIPQEQIDLSKLEPVPFKNTIGVLNEYILNTLDFINKYGHCSENKLYELDCVLDEIESKVLLLEKKLESVPAEIYNTMPQQPAQQQPAQQQPAQQAPVQTPSQDQVPQQQTPVVEAEAPPPPPPPEEEEMDENMKRYVKVYNLGVPLPVLKMRMQSEGYDPSLIDKYI